MLDKLTIIRSVDCRFSNHEPNMVMQTANREAEPRINPESVHYPAIASIVAKHAGRGDLALPPYVVLNMQSRSHVAFAGDLGKRYEPFSRRTSKSYLHRRRLMPTASTVAEFAGAVRPSASRLDQDG
jgi:hypothetical protein